MSWLPEWLSRAITPESYGENVVNSIYGSGGTLSQNQPDPEYDVNDLSSPNVYVAAKGAVVELAAPLRNAALLIAGFLILLVFVHGFAMRR